MIQLPDLRQRNGWTCGPVCAATVLTHYGKPIPRAWPASPIDGTDPLALVPLFRRAGLNVLAGEMSILDLQFQTRSMGRPVVCLVRLDEVGHYVVVTGVVRRRVYYHCPTMGLESEPVNIFADRWYDVGRDCTYHQFGISVWA